MTTKKPPTLAALRSLARRKGMDIEDIARNGTIQAELWWSNEMTHFASFHASTLHPIVRVAIFGALTALPDKPKERKR